VTGTQSSLPSPIPSRGKAPAIWLVTGATRGFGRAARIIVDVIVMDEPPRRLLLGAGAVTMAQESARLRADEIEKWAELSRSGDFPSAQ
jgi:hypothetical protein